MRQWPGSKRWLFVLNKMDAHERSTDAIRADFDDKLRRLGFEPTEESRFLVWITYRLGLPWWRETYLSLPFSGMALALLAAVLLPGCWLLSWAGARCGVGPGLGELVEQVDEPVATAALRGAHQRLHSILRQARSLRQAFAEARHTLDREGGLLTGLPGALEHNGRVQMNRGWASGGSL